VTADRLGVSLVFDSSPLNYFTRAGHLDTLEKLVEDRACLITTAVAEELQRGASRNSRLHMIGAQPWLSVVNDDSMRFLSLFSTFHGRLGGSRRDMKDIGEATTLAYAELHRCTAVVDDRVGRNIGTAYGISMSSSLHLLCHGLRNQLIAEEDACSVVDALRDAEAFLPCGGSDFLDWARAEGLLDSP
jgi:predicted nucleic acid-binding protein